MKKRWICLFAVLVLTAGVALNPVTGGAAPLEADGEGFIIADGGCSVTVYPENPNKPENERFGEDLAQAAVVVDIYRVADAVKVPGYDACRFVPEEEYEIEIPEYPKAEDWARLAKQAAVTAIEGSLSPVREGVAAGTRISDLDTGLYLLIARGRTLTDPKDYTMVCKDVTMKITQEAEEGKEAVTGIATIANSDRYTYIFAPQLISLPDRLTEEDGEGNVIYLSDWNFSPEVNLKPQQLPRYGSLEIVKTLSEYETMGGTQESATFVFEVTGTLNNEIVYSNVEAVTFTAAGQESVVLNRIPAGTEVTVTEIYSGSSYQLTVPGDRRAVIAADSVVSVEFENEYDGRRTNGHGIKNQFVYDAEQDVWNWYSSPIQNAAGNMGAAGSQNISGNQEESPADQNE